MQHASALEGIPIPAGTRWDSSPVVVGDVLLFSALTVHAAWSNVSPDCVRISGDVRLHRQSSPFLL